tara:strand:+ start:4084 stop:4257 length:174 start_codon:yes stop_codon:yes gene_type:complete
MKKITNEMVKYFIGDNKNNEAVNIIREIANSHKDNVPWSPKILYNDIRSTWNVKKEK